MPRPSRASLHVACGLLALLAGLLPAAYADEVLVGPYLQRMAPTAVVVRWRSDAASLGRLRLGTAPAALTDVTDEGAATTEHQIAVSGLSAQTDYWYSIGTSAGESAGPFRFTTPPVAGTVRPFRLWAMGDFGTGGTGQYAVRDAFRAWNHGRQVDGMLALGDNAYVDGTDAQHVHKFFAPYRDELATFPFWVALGNHDTNHTRSPPPTLPCFTLFTRPAAGECGGLASGSQRYFSVDLGNIHLICLDSQSSDTAPGGAMATWLQADLAATTALWRIAFFHHGPYSRGSHNSDRDAQMTEMRRDIVPLLEAGGVDLVLGGHSHDYERSCLLDGHYGKAASFLPAMRLDAGDGREEGDGAYRKAPGANQGAVYAIAGSGGELYTPASFGHPAMRIGVARRGSLAIDVTGDRLDARFVDALGADIDHFTIIKSAGGSPPVVNGATAVVAGDGLSITCTATASDDGGEPALAYWWTTAVAPDGATVAFSANGGNTAKTTVAMPDRAGDYRFRVAAVDADGHAAVQEVACSVLAAATSLSVIPAVATVPVGDLLPLAADLRDQFGGAMPAGAVVWSCDSGSVSAAGFVGTGVATATVTATAGILTANTTISVTTATIVATPIIDPAGGTIRAPMTVTLACPTIGAELRCTIDGSAPDAASPIYAGPFAIGPETTTVRVRGFLAGRLPSAIVNARFSPAGSDGGCGSVLGLLVGMLGLTAWLARPQKR